MHRQKARPIVKSQSADAGLFKMSKPVMRSNGAHLPTLLEEDKSSANDQSASSSPVPPPAPAVPAGFAHSLGSWYQSSIWEEGVPTPALGVVNLPQPVVAPQPNSAPVKNQDKLR